MRIVNIIYEHLAQMKADNVILESVYTYPPNFNVLAGSLQVPCALLITPQDWTLDVDFTTARESGYFSVYFLTFQKELNFDASSNEILVDDMIDNAVDLISRLRADKRIHIEDANIQGASIYDAENRNLTGCRLKIKLKESQGRCIPAYGGCL